MLGLSFEPEIKVKKPVEAMQATVLDEMQLPNQGDEANLPETFNAFKKLSRVEKKRLARAKKQALRLEQAERKKILASVAQRLLVSAIEAKKHEQQNLVVQEKIGAKQAEQKKAAILDAEKIKQEKFAQKQAVEAKKKKLAEQAAQAEKIKQQQQAEAEKKKAAVAEKIALEKAKEDRLRALEQSRLQQAEKIRQEKQEALRLAEAEKKKAAIVKKLALEKAREKQLRALEVQRLKQTEIEHVKALKQQRAEEKLIKQAEAQKQAQLEKLKIAQDDKLRAQLRIQLITAIKRKITTHWNRPVGTEGLVCVIRVQLNSSGQVKKALVKQTSGNSMFDESAVNAVYKSNHFQMPDDKQLLQEIVLEGLAVNFGDE